MTTLHALAALTTAIAFGAMVVVGVIAALQASPPWWTAVWIDRSLLAALGGAALAIAVGLLQLATGARPADPLHFLYAIAIVLVCPLTRLGARSWTLRRRSALMALAAAVSLALLARSWMTG